MAEALNKSQLQQLRTAIAAKRFVFKGPRLSPVEKHYFEWCKRVGRPCIRIHLRKVNADLRFDLPGFNNFTEHFDQKGSTLFAEFYKRWGFDRDYWPSQFGEKTSHIFRAPKVLIFDMADELFKIGSQFIARRVAENQRITQCAIADVKEPHGKFVCAPVLGGEWEEKLGCVMGNNLYKCVIQLANGEIFFNVFKFGEEPPAGYFSLHKLAHLHTWTRVENVKLGGLEL